MSESKM